MEEGGVFVENLVAALMQAAMLCIQCISSNLHRSKTADDPTLNAARLDADAWRPRGVCNLPHAAHPCFEHVKLREHDILASFDVFHLFNDIFVLFAQMPHGN